MAVVIDSDSVPEEDRLEYWSTELSRTFINPVQLQFAAGVAFRRKLLAHSLNQVKVFRLTGAASVMARTPETISAFDGDYLSLMIQLRGHCSQAQGGRSAQLVAGDATSHDSSEPFVVRSPAPFEVLIFAFPKVLLRPHVEEVCGQTAVRISSDSGAGSVALPFLRRVGDALQDSAIAEDDVNISESVVHLIKALYLRPPAARGGPRQPQRHSGDIMRRIRSSIEERLGDPGLSPETIAELNYVSTSYLHRLFGKHEGMSMGAWVRATRLRRCRRDLMDPSLADRRIIDIASDWGFPTASHFSRAFRNEFGCSPRELRRGLRHPTVDDGGA
jgi:AraC-like DNA-binding protein